MENILKTMLFENDDITIIMRFSCPSFPQTQIFRRNVERKQWMRFQNETWYRFCSLFPVNMVLTYCSSVCFSLFRLFSPLDIRGVMIKIERDIECLVVNVKGYWIFWTDIPLFRVSKLLLFGMWIPNINGMWDTRTPLPSPNALTGPQFL